MFKHVSKNTILQQATDREPLRKASTAVRAVQNAVRSAISRKYDDRSETVEGSTPLIMGVASVIFGFGAGLSLIGIMFGVACAYCAIGALVSCGELVLTAVDPSFASVREFKLAARRLTSITAEIPDQSLQRSLRRFSTEASKSFVLGHVAVLQDQIVQGEESPSMRDMAFEQGIRLIDMGTVKMKWNDGDTLKNAFRNGQLPKAETIAMNLSLEHDSVQKGLEDAIQDIQLQPSRPRPANPGDFHGPGGASPS
jgi:hypothetical protein